MFSQSSSSFDYKFAEQENIVLWDTLKSSPLPYLNLTKMASAIDGKVIEVMKDLEQYQISCPRMRNIPPMAGQLLNILVKCSHAKTIVEAGTANGYSTLWLASAAKQTGGYVFTYEKFDWKAKMAITNIAKSGLQDSVKVICGDVVDKVCEINRNIDFVFLDIWTGDYVSCFNTMKDKFRPGTIIVADNIVAHRNREGIPISNEGESDEYISLVRTSPNLSSAFIPMGSGLEITFVEE